ncbi:Nucleic acid-binding, OB-fold [Phytophthora cactorum]|nr:Nucleic acid-binding, OB-fold [Phytophthora cactorum]
MALFNAVRRYVEPKNKGESLKENGKHDGIIVVGDGNTPRTAAMFAFRMRGWKCYSVDPAMEKGTSERSKGWADVSNLVTVRNKIENVRIALRRAIVVLVHAHVTLDQALSAVQAEQVCGVVTLPCCNWYGQQETLFGRGPDLVYDDFSVLSDHREIRLWVGDSSTQRSGEVNISHADFSLASSVMKGCVRKEIVETSETVPESTTDTLKQHDGEEFMAEEQTIGSSLPSAVASHLEADTHVLALGWHPRRLAVRLLLRDGYSNVYTISLADELSFSFHGERGTKTLKLQLHKCTVDVDTDAGNEEEKKDEDAEEEEKITVTFESFIFRGFRGRAKKNAVVFPPYLPYPGPARVTNSSTTTNRKASLVCLTSRKQWRKKEFLAHEDLGYDVQSLIATRKQFPGSPVYVYCCYKLQKLAALQSTVVGAGDDNTIARDAALETWLELEKKLKDRQSELDGSLVVIDSPKARVKAAQEQEQARDTATEPRKVYVQVTGEITRVRRFSNGMSFLSLELTGSGYDRPLQVFLQRDTLGWSPQVFAKVVSLLRKGDELVAVGFMARNARGHSMLQVEALSLARI